MSEEKEFVDGFYNLYSPDEDEPTLVQCYFSMDVGARVLGFNIHDGGGLVPVKDFREDCRLEPVVIVDQKEIDEEIERLKELREKLAD
jgi:hypothetical protein